MPRAKRSGNISKARALRARMSLPEVLLWNELRQQAEVKFRRQHPLGPYILDFYCPRAKVAIEIDGIAHDLGGRPEWDAARAAWLEAEGLEVIRLPASDVLKSSTDVADALVRHCKR